jgi:hypothetical protein
MEVWDIGRVKLRRLLALLVALLPVGLLATTAYADDPRISLIRCNFPLNHNVSVAAGSPLTLATGWGMSNRGNLFDFIHAATVTMTVDGQAVTPTQAEPILVDSVDNDTWLVFWTFNTVAPAVGQVMVVTFNIVLDHQVVDHSLVEFGLAGPGQPAIIPAGPTFTPDLLCNVHGT